MNRKQASDPVSYDPKQIRLAMVMADVDTIETLTEKSGVSATTIRAILGGGDAKVSTLDKIARALGVRTADFFLHSTTSLLVKGTQPESPTPAA